MIVRKEENITREVNKHLDHLLSVFRRSFSSSTLNESVFQYHRKNDGYSPLTPVDGREFSPR